MRVDLEGARCPPSQPSPAARGKETLPHAGIELTYSSVFLPHLWGRTEVRTNDSSARYPPSRPSPAARGKETLPHAGIELTYNSVFLPHTWGRIEVGDKQLPLRAIPHPGLPPRRGGRRRCRMLVLKWHEPWPPLNFLVIFLLVTRHIVQPAHHKRRQHKGQVNNHVPHQLVISDIARFHKHAQQMDRRDRHNRGRNLVF